MRLFVALTPPPEVLGELRAVVEAVRGDQPGLRWTEPEQWHLTCAFLGEVDDATRADLETRLARAARRHPPPELALRSAGRFGQRVLWTGVDGEVAVVRRLAASVRAAARRAGPAVDDRPYRPHLTLARARDPETDLRPLVEALVGFSGSAWTARDLHLVRSHLGAGPGGTARHEALVSWRLSGGEAGRQAP